MFVKETKIKDNTIKEILELIDTYRGNIKKGIEDLEKELTSKIDSINTIQYKEKCEREGIDKRVEYMENENRKFIESIEKKNQLILKQQEEIDKNYLPFVRTKKSIEEL